MALTTYAQLQDEVLLWTRRTDVAARIPGFITLAEAQMNRRLRVRRMIARATATITNAYSAVPADFLGVRSFSVAGSPARALAFVTPDQMDRLTAEGGSGGPDYYSVVGGEFRYHPAPTDGQTASLTYYAAIPALSEANLSNWVLRSHPDAYLYGALVQSAPYLRADERLATWGTLFTQALADIESADAAESLGATLTPGPSTARAGDI